MHILEGVEIEVRVSLWKKIADLMLKLLESGELPPFIMPILGGVSPLALLKINGHLDIVVDDYMKEKIKSNPMVEPLMMDAATLITAASQVHSDEDEEFEEHVREKIGEPFIFEMVNFMVKHLGDEVEVSVAHKYAGVKKRITAEGLGLLLKAILKF